VRKLRLMMLRFCFCQMDNCPNKRWAKGFNKWSGVDGCWWIRAIINDVPSIGCEISHNWPNKTRPKATKVLVNRPTTDPNLLSNFISHGISFIPLNYKAQIWIRINLFFKFICIYVLLYVTIIICGLQINAITKWRHI